MPGAQVRIGEIWKEFKEFAHRQKEGRKFAQKHCPRKRNEIKRVVNDLMLRGPRDFPWKGVGG